MRLAIYVQLTLMAVVLAAALASGGESPPCECDKRLSPAQAFERASLVFFGQPNGFYHGGGARREWQQYWEFDVEGVWKGPAQPHIRIYASGEDGPNSCDEQFEVGKRYLVYAYLEEKFPNRYRVSTCSRTTTAERSIRDLTFLGRPAHSFSE